MSSALINPLNMGLDITNKQEQQNGITKEDRKIVLPEPTTKEQLNQLLYRYKATLDYPEDNKTEIDAIECVLNNISSKQEEYIKQLEQLRASIGTNVEFDEETLNEQLVALNFLERDLEVADDMFSDLDDHEILKSTDEGNEAKPVKLNPIKLSMDLEHKAESFGLAHKFDGPSPTVLGNTKVELSISSFIAKRISELERLPANLGTYSLEDSLEFVTKNDIPSSLDQHKIKALIELKCLKLLTKQKSLRQKLYTNVTNQAHHNIPQFRDSPLTMAAQRAVQIRSKVNVPQTVRLAEELERQQLLEKRKFERNLHMQKLNEILEAVQERQESEFNRFDRATQFGRVSVSVHNQIERDEQKKMERTAKQRLAALKSNDEEAYLKLLDQTKDTRITQLLRQTNTFLDSLAQAVRVQQNEAKILNGEEVAPITDEEREKIDYYEVAHQTKEEITKQPPMLVGGTLKEYQIRGLEWMVSLYNNHLNGILADEMGLGKTIQSISLIAYLYEIKKEPGPYLVIVPLSTITNWTLEFEKWAPTLKTVIYKGTPNQRRTLQNQIRIGDFDVLLTTYEYIIKDRSLLAKNDWAHMIIDEGHRMKNAQSKLSYTIQHHYRTRNRLILTGTPLQNNLPELWALLNFVLPKIFNSAKTFDDWFNTPFANTGGQEKLELTEEETLLIIRRLHKVLRPFLLRRLKKEVEKDLPDKVEKVVKCKLSGLQHRLYQQMLKHNALFVGAGTEGATKGGIKGLNNKIMQLRKICNHPFVFDEVEGVINPSRSNSDLLYRVSGKFELLDRILHKFKVTGHRVLLFFQMTQVMDIMEDFLRMRDLKYMRLDGTTKTEDRTTMLKAFNAPNSKYFCFLLSTRAGGLGLNLQSADTVIIFDTDWNPHQDLQAQDRAHRIGQKNEVRILRLITTDSVEEVILERAMQKLDIDSKVIQAGKFDNKSTAEEQEAFLRRLIENESNKDEEDDAELDDDELNETLARNEDEKILFDKMDKERIALAKAEAKKEGLKQPLSRLIQVNELPQVFLEDIEDHLKVEPEVTGRTRETKRVYYDDGLTEEQFLRAVEDDSTTLEEVISQKRSSRLRKPAYSEDDIDENEENETLNNTPDIEDDVAKVEEEAVVEEEVKELTPAKNKKSSARTGNNKNSKKRSLEQIDGPELQDSNSQSGVKISPEESNVKKPKLKIKLKLNPETLAAVSKSGTPQIEKPKAKTKATSTNANSSKKGKKEAAASKTSEVTTKIRSLLSELHGQLDESDEHQLTEIFQKLPSKKLYPDYYQVIKTPVAIETIEKNCKNNSYKTLDQAINDFNTMFENAKFYNVPDSWVYNDATKLSEYVEKWCEDNFN